MNPKLKNQPKERAAVKGRAHPNPGGATASGSAQAHNPDAGAENNASFKTAAACSPAASRAAPRPARRLRPGGSPHRKTPPQRTPERINPDRPNPPQPTPERLSTPSQSTDSRSGRGRSRDAGSAADANSGGSALILSNCTATPRGLALSRGMVILGPREMRPVPLSEQAEVRALFRCRTFQRFVDNGVFRLSELSDNDADVEVKTPPPPATLTRPVSLDGVLECSIGPGTGERAARPTLIGYQQDLPDPVRES